MPENILKKRASMVRFVQKKHKQNFQFSIISTKRQLTELCQKIKKSKIMYVNIQGTDLDAQVSACAGISIAVDASQVYFIARHSNEDKGTLTLHEVFAKIAPLLADGKIEKVMHNAVYTQTIFARNEAPVKGKVFDIMTAVNLLLYEDTPQVNFEMIRDFYAQQAAISYEQVVMKHKVQDGAGHEVGVDRDLWFSIADVHQTVLLHQFLQKELVKQSGAHFFDMIDSLVKTAC